MNEIEAVYTRPFEDIYTAGEVELNNKLYEECLKDPLDCARIEELLEHGADPLGAMAVSGWDLLEHVYGEVVYGLYDSFGKNLPRITELFLKHGMDIDHPRIPYDEAVSINPMWGFTCIMSENVVHASKLLLDRGMSVESAQQMWDHTIMDLIHIDCGDPNEDEFWREYCTWTMKMLMLCASYDHIIEHDEYLRDWIGFSYNSYDLHKFRNWNDFYYEFDTSHCTRGPEFHQSIVRIFEAESKKEIWKIGICLKEGEF